MALSTFGTKFSGKSGITELMHDLGNALSGEEKMLMLGGGNPSHIPAVQAVFRERMETILQTEGAFEVAIGNYDTPQGQKAFLHALADLLRNQFGWDVTAENIALTNGSQSAFFLLFNMFGGQFDDGSHKQICLPLTPEYIGYNDVGIAQNLFASNRPEIQLLDNHMFKYRVNFENIHITPDIGAICVSRPTNPTGNVITDEEVNTLSQLADEHNIPLILDNAYGVPFPGIIFSEATPIWNENIILSMSLSKLGLPSSRTGIIIANKETISQIAAINGILSLSPGGLGPALAQDLVASGEIIHLSQNVIKPYYQEKSQRAFAQLSAGLDGVDFRIHKPEGALFLWLWVKDLPISSEELYERLKARGVLVVSGHYFFAGMDDDPWAHKNECIRITYAQDDAVVEEGLAIIADEIQSLYR